MKRKYMHSCPHCRHKDKVIEKCVNCGKLCCTECSHDNLCHDCLAKTKRWQFSTEYFKDKYSRPAGIVAILLISLMGMLLVDPLCEAFAINDSNLKMLWKMDESGSPLTQDATNGVNNNLIGVTTGAGSLSYQVTDDKPSWASYSIDFGGAEDNYFYNWSNASMRDTLNALNDEFTMGCWVTYDSTGDRTFISMHEYINPTWRGFAIMQTSDPGYPITFFSDGDQYATKIGQGIKNTYVIARVNSTSLSIFLNNTLNYTINTFNSITDNTQGWFMIGGRKPESSFINDWDGHISNCFIYDGQLTDAQITDIVLNGFSAPNSKPTTPNITSPLNNTAYNSVGIKYSSTDGDGDPITYRVYINNTLNYTGSANLTNWVASDGAYTVQVSAYDSKEYSSNSTVSYFYLDNVKPVISFGYPQADNSSTATFNATMQLNINFTDNNLFRYECLITNPAGALSYNFSNTTILAGFSYLNSNITLNTTGNYKVACDVWDGHTAGLIDTYKQETVGTLTTFEFTEKQGYELKKTNITIEYNGVEELIKTDSAKETDRYTFSYEFNIEKGITKPIRHEFKIECDGLFYVNNPEYIADFVCWDAKKWIDFNSEQVIEYDVYSCGTDCFSVVMLTKPDAKIEFNSIGDLNTASRHARIAVSAASGSVSNSILDNFDCPDDSQSEVLLFGVIFMIMAAIWYACHSIMRVPVMAIAASVGFMVIGFSVAACNGWIGFIIIITALMTILYEFAH